MTEPTTTAVAAGRDGDAATPQAGAPASHPRTGGAPGVAVVGVDTPDAPEPLLSRLRAPLATAGAVGAGTLLVALRTPHEPNSYGFCPLLLFTGLACPLCGGLRGTYEMAHLDLAGAWAMNPLWVLLAPALVMLWAVWFSRRARGLAGPRFPAGTPWAVLATLVVFGILRNLPPLIPSLTPWL